MTDAELQKWIDQETYSLKDRLIREYKRYRQRMDYLAWRLRWK